MLYIIKKDGSKEGFNPEKIVNAVKKSAYRALKPFGDDEEQKVLDYVNTFFRSFTRDSITIPEMHNLVENALDTVDPMIAKSYRDYRNYKQDFTRMLDEVYKKSQAIMYVGDKENSNTDSALVSTKRSLIFNQLNKELYQKFFMTSEEIQACRDGYIYVHDMAARRDTMNCCLFDVEAVLNGGFEMGNIWYNEPKSLDTAFDVIGDVVLSAASQQYGGFTLPQIDETLAKYAKYSYDKYYAKNLQREKKSLERVGLDYYKLNAFEKARLDMDCVQEAKESVKRDMEQGFQGWEYKFNTVASSRGDYPFITISIGVGTDEWSKMAAIAALTVRKNGQGKPNKKVPVLFPKVVFLYTKELHGPGKQCEDVFEVGVECSSKSMYPDWLSLDGDNTIGHMWTKFHKVISPMGCRAFLSPYYTEGGINPAHENDEPIFIGRFNGGAISLHLPMILAKSRQENRDFYEVLNYYMELSRNLHKRTCDYLGEMRASTNPLAYCEGGFLNGHLGLHEKIKPLMKYVTWSFGITALNELNMLYNGESITTDGKFPLEVMQYINDKLKEFKEQDNMLYAVYGTPAENLCGLQVEQFRKKYGIINGVSDRSYVSNSFHCHVSEDLRPTEKQDLEYRFWNLFEGGRIQYVKYPINYNLNAIKALINRAMDMGLYEGVNMALSFCEDCGYEQLDMNTCPECGSENLRKIDRMNGYLSYSRVHGDSRLNDAKMDEIKDRVSM